MKFTTTEIAGLVCIEPEPYSDQQDNSTEHLNGKVSHAWFRNWILFSTTINNYSKGTWRGLHFQYPPYAEIKLIRCIRGSIWDVVVDLRKDSSTFWNGKVLNCQQKIKWCYLFLRNGSWIHYIGKSKWIDIPSYFPYQPNSEGGIRYDDPLLKLQLPYQ